MLQICVTLVTKKPDVKLMRQVFDNRFAYKALKKVSLA